MAAVLITQKPTPHCNEVVYLKTKSSSYAFPYSLLFRILSVLHASLRIHCPQFVLAMLCRYQSAIYFESGESEEVR